MKHKLQILVCRSVSGKFTSQHRGDGLSLFFILPILALLWGTVSNAASSQPLMITGVSLDKQTFDPSKGEYITLTIAINQKADVNVKIYDRLSNEVRLYAKSIRDTGKCEVTWDGRQKNGKLAAGNLFLYVIEATNPAGEKVVYNQAPQTGGLKVKPLEYTFDKKTGRITYVLPKACMVRLRVGLKDGMLIQTLFDWQPQTAGRHSLVWDGKDASGLMNLREHPELELNLTCYRVPANTIMTTGNIIALAKPKTKNTNLSLDLWSTTNKYLHYTHDPFHCHEPKFTVSFPLATKEDGNETPMVTNTTPIRVVLDPRDARYIISKRFEVMLFVDGTYFFEMEEATSPFTFNWNTKGFKPGLHTVTVNVMSYDDHIGVVSQPVIIGEQK